jgi:hypothetical protein
MIKYIFIILFLFSFFYFLNKNIKNIEYFSNNITNQDINIYIGITSIPIRLKYIHNTLNSLLNQTEKPKKIFVFLPDKSVRLNIDYNINDIQKDKINDPNNIIQYITGISDEGPITKFYSLLDNVPKGENNYLFLADDDVIYPETRISNIKKYIDIKSNNSYGLSGRSYIKHKNGKENLLFYTIKDGIKDVDILETFDMTAYPRNIFPDSSIEFLNWVKELPKESFFVDDIILAFWCKLNNSKKFIIPHDEFNKYYGEVDDVPEEVKKVELRNENLKGRNLSIYKKLFFNFGDLFQ